MKDLEASAFQKRPCYRYVRESDHIPTLFGIDAIRDPVAHVKLFNPSGSGSWYIAAYDPESRIAWGMADIWVGEFELGEFDMQELSDYRGPYGLPLERDLHWTPRPLSSCAGS